MNELNDVFPKNTCVSILKEASRDEHPFGKVNESSCSMNMNYIILLHILCVNCFVFQRCKKTNAVFKRIHVLQP